jgi:hypothetical protein
MRTAAITVNETFRASSTPVTRGNSIGAGNDATSWTTG